MRQRRRGSVQRVTMSDVARVAEVSPMTVSRALNQPDAVRPELRERVQEAVRKTGYIHDRIASALASHRSGMIAVILPTIASSMFSDSVRGISEVARARLREDGYRAGLTARALHAPQVVYVEDLTSMRSGALVADMVTALAPQPDALFCLNDVLAAGALLALQRKGLRVPDALGVAGFGGFDFAEHLVPSLTTVDVPRYAIGHEAACVLMDRIEGLADAHKISRTEFQICLRESTRDIIL